MPRSFLKDDSAVLDYQFNWAGERPWLTGGDTIVSHTVTAASGLTVDSTEATGTAVTVWLSGGTVGQSYAVTCHIVTAAGREDDRTATVTVMER